MTHTPAAEQSEARALDAKLLVIESEFNAFAARGIRDSNVRMRYQRLISEMSREVRAYALRTGNYAEAAELANRLRNHALEVTRTSSSDIGRVVAKTLKPQGRTLDFLLDRVSSTKFQKPFHQLKDSASVRKVFLGVIESAGHSNRSVSLAASVLGKASRGLIVATVGIAVYDVATADDKARAVARQGTGITLGFALSVAGGWAGLVCGPGAVVCVPMGVFVGGALGAIGADFLF